MVKGRGEASSWATDGGTRVSGLPAPPMTPQTALPELGENLGIQAPSPSLL